MAGTEFEGVKDSCCGNVIRQIWDGAKMHPSPPGIDFCLFRESLHLLVDVSAAEEENCSH